MSDWSFLTNHGLVLVYMARYPDSTARQIAAAVKVTEWTVHKIISELVKSGYIERERVGRRNSYRVNVNLALRHDTLQDADVGALLAGLGWKRGSGSTASSMAAHPKASPLPHKPER